MNKKANTIESIAKLINIYSRLEKNLYNLTNKTTLKRTDT